MADLHIHRHPVWLQRSRPAQPVRWPVYAVVILSLLVSLALWVALIATISAIFHHGL